MAAAITLLLLVGLLSGGVVAAATGCDDDSANFPVRGGANQLAAAASSCTTPMHLSGGACDTPRFATELVKFCKPGMDAPGAVCCTAVLFTVDAADSGCLCRVIGSFEFIMSDLSVSQLWDWYTACGGKHRSIPLNKDSCESASAPPPPPPPAKPEAPSVWPARTWVAVALLCAGVIGAAVFVALKLFLRRAAQVPLPTEEDITTTPLTGVTTGPEDGSLRAGEAAIIDITATDKGEEEEEEEVSPPGRVEVEERGMVARPRLPPAPPFRPLLPVMLPPLAGPPLQITAY